MHLGPSGEPVTVSRASLDRWIRAWRAGGFDALIPAERQVAPRTEAEVLELAARLKRDTGAHRRAHRPDRRGRAGGRPRRAPCNATSPAWSSPDRRQPAEGVRPVRGRRTDEMWVSDGLHGPIVAGGRAVLFALLDDHSRYVVGHRWGHGEDTLGMQAALHDAVKTHGCRKTVLRQSIAYASGQLAWSAAVLDIRLVQQQARENRRDAGKSSAGTAPCATSSWSRSRPPAGSVRWMI